VAESDDRDLYSGLIRLHVLASEEPIFGLGMIEELGRHGYNLSDFARSRKEGVSPLDGTARRQVTTESVVVLPLGAPVWVSVLEQTARMLI
jgi:hypothetical protein